MVSAAGLLVLLLSTPLAFDVFADVDQFVADGKHEQAVEALLAAREAGDADAFQVELALGQTYLSWADAIAASGGSGDDVNGMLYDARSHLENAVKYGDGSDNAAVVTLGNVVLYRFGDHEHAYKLAAMGIENDAEDPEVQLLRGCAGVYVYWNHKQGGDEASMKAAQDAWQLAIDDLKAAKKALPDERTEPSAQLCWLYEDAGRPVQAVEAQIEVVNRSEDPSFDTLYRLAKRYAYEGQFTASGKAMEKLVAESGRDVTNRLKAEEDPNGVAIQLSWSIHPYAQRNDAATARAILAPIMAVEPNDPTVWDNYAVMCQLTSRFDDAVKAYERRIELDGGDPRAYNDLGAILHHDLGGDENIDRARELYSECIALADTELAKIDIEPSWRAHCEEAKGVAQGNLEGAQPRRGLLDSVLEGLRGLDLPEGESEDGDGASEGASEG